MNNYPPGVTGNEPEIVGYDDTWEPTICPFCGYIGIMQKDEPIYATSIKDTHDLQGYVCPDCEYIFFIGV